MMLQVSGDSVAEKLAALGVVVYNGRGDMLLTSVPREVVEQVLSMQDIYNVSMSGDMSRCLDKAREMSRVELVRTMINCPDGLTGKGVVAGIADIGFDAGHIAFSDNLKAVYDYQTDQGLRSAIETPSALAEWSTDRVDECHATHVAGILAGGYDRNGYQGVAPGVSLVATTSDLSDVGLLAGVEDIIAYAKSQGEPAVVNMSVSNSLGPHDGTDLFCRYLSLLAEDATICISAGNSGFNKNYASHFFSPDAAEAGVMFNTYRTWDGFAVDGICDVWSEDSTPFEYSLSVYNIDTGEMVSSTGWLSSDDLFDTKGSFVSGYLDGKIEVAVSQSSLNGRYNMTMQYEYTSPMPSSRGQWALYYLALQLRGKDGKRVDLYTDGARSFMGRTRGSDTYVGPDGSINDLCTADGVVAVGACVSDNCEHLSDREDVVNGDFTVGNVASFTSYSNVPSIKKLPHICAPGAYLVSALSSPFHWAYPEKELPAHEDTVDGKSYFWRSMCGTSMSSPFVAGVFALWLEAKPWLSTSELLEAACLTARRDFDDIDDPRWGAGCIDALAGLNYLTTSSVTAVDDSELKIEINYRRVSVSGADSYRLYDIQGRVIDPASSLCPGIYILKADNGYVTKILIK